MKKEKENKFKMANQAKPCGCTHTHTHTDILLIENKFASITELSSVICHEIKEYVKN